ncbi:MAG: hypothetical protein IPL53_25225 [Ignavibacteria bacterium]|nr:hypothetical protein [Ignavibacteria bacterium]
MSDANNGYLVSGANVWKTTNGGSNWDRLTTLPASLSWNKVQTFSNTTLYLGGGNRIYKSFNAGATWDSALIPSTAGMFNMDWVDLNYGTVVGTAGYTAKTSNGGLTWTERNPGSSTLPGVSMPSKDTVFAVCDRNVWGAIFRLYDVNTSIVFNLTIGIEGFWNGSSQAGDTVKCHLRNSVSPFNEAEVTAAYIDNSGNGTFTFTSAPSGSYYIEVTHRNSIETWSASPQSVVSGGNYNYNFTTAASQAYGNNMVSVSGRYCNYSGDVNQDDAVNLEDLLETYNASSNFATGYVSADVNGNNFVDLSDITIVYNNTKKFVSKVTP